MYHLEFLKHLISTLMSVDCKIDFFCPNFDSKREAVKKIVHLFVTSYINKVLDLFIMLESFQHLELYYASTYLD